MSDFFGWAEEIFIGMSRNLLRSFYAIDQGPKDGLSFRHKERIHERVSERISRKKKRPRREIKTES